MAAAGRGEHRALTDLFRAYQPMLVRYLRGQDPGVADDLAGEVWLEVARRLGRFIGNERGFRAWLFTIARCRLIEHRRRLARRRTDAVDHGWFDRPAASSDRDDPALVLADRMSAQDAVRMVVTGLPPDQAEAVLLRVVAELDVPEIARIMGRSSGSVRVLCHRGLRRLAARLVEEEVYAE